MPNHPLAIEAFIRARLTELGLSDDEFLHRLGYRKIRKGREHLQHLYLGCFHRPHMVQRLPTALEQPQSIVRGVVEETGRQLRAVEETPTGPTGGNLTKQAHPQRHLHRRNHWSQSALRIDRRDLPG